MAAAASASNLRCAIRRALGALKNCARIRVLLFSEMCVVTVRAASHSMVLHSAWRCKQIAKKVLVAVRCGSGVWRAKRDSVVVVCFCHKSDSLEQRTCLWVAERALPLLPPEAFGRH